MFKNWAHGECLWMIFFAVYLESLCCWCLRRIQESFYYFLYTTNISFNCCPLSLAQKQIQLWIPQISEKLWWPVGTCSSLQCLLSSTVWFPSVGNKFTWLDCIQSVRFTSYMNDTAPAVWSSVSPPHRSGLGSDNIAQRTSCWCLSWWASARNQQEIIVWGSIRLMETGK